ncbi:MAG: hypothetical protein A2676_00065 [Candidatus Sungbacteria bacterium RIFCSPHIGHO2_01_FULL_51_22]|nr:MAG: hypothetical protein A2676_00065 [Candidatus Sungbacteria bacterium RIFCSPHIGHO2_01_FULL_51_22]OHA06870.1 MAG: hypothetical protein A3B29_01630 [Candidatus Sungbacteria bacterium RIFCSPLOWO2_01_FULL_51_34]
MQNFSFEIIASSLRSRARAGVLRTPHGDIETPSFITVGTQAAVKAVTPDDIRGAGSQAILANTYHLFLSRTHEVIQGAGGLGAFMGWDGPTLTDSGGFQVFSLGFGRDHDIGRSSTLFPGEDIQRFSKVMDVKESQHIKILEEGALFRLPDGTKKALTPESSIQIQEAIGADIVFAFDECTSPLSTYDYTKEAMGRTHRWAERCLAARTHYDQALFGIVQGGIWEDLREESCRIIGGLPFSGFGIGGFLGRTKEEMWRVAEFVIARIPDEKPRHLLGIGTSEDISEMVRRGIDTFDCVAPTREARNGLLYTADGRLSIGKVAEREQYSPIDAGCACYTCTTSTRAYLHHLWRQKELSYYRLATIHNLFFMNARVSEIREKILRGEF